MKQISQSTELARRDTVLSPRFYTTDFAALDRIDVEPIRTEWDILLEEFRRDANKGHFERTAAFAAELRELPEPLRGEFVVHLRTAYLGPAELAEKVLAPMRSAGPVILDTIAELTYAAAATIHLDPPSPLPYVDRSSGLAQVNRDTVDALVGVAGPGSGCELASIEIRHLGGALDRPPRTPDAVPARGLPFQLFAFGVGPAEQAPALREQLAGLVEAVQPWADQRRMMAFLSPDEATDPQAVRQLYGADRYDRLARIKRRYDPDNLFHLNQNIVPPSVPTPRGSGA